VICPVLDCALASEALIAAANAIIAAIFETICRAIA
jgi:hypothetical protein